MTAGIIGGRYGPHTRLCPLQQGMKVERLEASHVLRGHAGPQTLDDRTAMARFPHALLSSDSRVRHLCAEWNIADGLPFRETKMGLYFEHEMDASDGTSAYMDDHIGEPLAELQEHGSGEDPLNALTADHGQLFGAHGLPEHVNSLYRDALHAPLHSDVASHSGQERGVTCRELQES